MCRIKIGKLEMLKPAPQHQVTTLKSRIPAHAKGKKTPSEEITATGGYTYGECWEQTVSTSHKQQRLGGLLRILGM